MKMQALFFIKSLKVNVILKFWCAKEVYIFPSYQVAEGHFQWPGTNCAVVLLLFKT